MAWLRIFFIHEYSRSCNSSCLDPFYSYHLIPEERKTFWSELESNPGPLASQGTALTIRPWLLGQVLYLLGNAGVNRVLFLFSYLLKPEEKRKHLVRAGIELEVTHFTSNHFDL